MPAPPSPSASILEPLSTTEPSPPPCSPLEKEENGGPMLRSVETSAASREEKAVASVPAAEGGGRAEVENSQ